MYKKHAYPKLWIAGAISNGIASLFFGIRHYHSDFRIIGNLFSLLTAIILGISVFFEYYKEIYLTQENKSNLEIMSIAFGFLTFVTN